MIICQEKPFQFTSALVLVLHLEISQSDGLGIEPTLARAKEVVTDLIKLVLNVLVLVKR